MGNNGLTSVVEGSILVKKKWASRLYADPAFVPALTQRWRELRAAGLVEDLLVRVDRHAARLSATGAARRNFDRWPVLGVRVWPNPPESVDRTTYRSEVDALRTWLLARVAWMDAHVHELAVARSASNPGGQR